MTRTMPERKNRTARPQRRGEVGAAHRGAPHTRGPGTPAAGVGVGLGWAVGRQRRAWSRRRILRRRRRIPPPPSSPEKKNAQRLLAAAANSDQRTLARHTLAVAGRPIAAVAADPAVRRGRSGGAEHDGAAAAAPSCDRQISTITPSWAAVAERRRRQRPGPPHSASAHTCGHSPPVPTHHRRPRRPPASPRSSGREKEQQMSADSADFDFSIRRAAEPRRFRFAFPFNARLLNTTMN